MNTYQPYNFPYYETILTHIMSKYLFCIMLICLPYFIHLFSKHMFIVYMLKGNNSTKGLK